ncbi:MAG: hypothetical protein ACOC9H_02030 [Gemmatimonadota bacterium]
MPDVFWTTERVELVREAALAFGWGYLVVVLLLFVAVAVHRALFGPDEGDR